jgi:hypothetical protein
MISNRTARIVPTALLAVSLAGAPFIGAAQENRVMTMPGICASLDDTRNRVTSAVDERVATAVARYEEHLAELETRLNGFTADVESARSENDAALEAKIQEMLGRAATDAQRSAVNDYADTVRDLLKTRRASLDSAFEAFATDVRALRDEREGEYEDLLAQYEANITAAFDTADASCQAGTAPAEVGQTLRAELREVQQSFRSDRTAFTFREEFRTLRTERVNAATAAREQFRAGVQAANQDLRTALGL